MFCTAKRIRWIFSSRPLNSRHLKRALLTSVVGRYVYVDVTNGVVVVGWLVGWLGGWWVGWLVGWFVVVVDDVVVVVDDVVVVVVVGCLVC